MSKNTDKLFVYDELFQTIICFNKVTRWLIFSPMALCISRMKSSLQKKNENWKQKNTNWHMLYFDTLQIGRPFLHKAGSHDSCCSNLNQKSMICANIFNWQSIALVKNWIIVLYEYFFYEFIIRNYPSLYFSFWTTQVWIVFLLRF